MKKTIITTMSICLGLSLFVNINNVSATDFSGQEDTYMTLCSSSNLSTGNLATCKEFNSYLKNKNASLKKEAASAKATLDSTQASLDEIQSQLNTINSDISTKESEITYLETSITNLEASIAKKEQEVKDRMYAMQAYNNSNSYVDFIFGAESFSDMFSRIASVNQITEYDNDLVVQLADEKKQVETQKTTVETAKANLESQKQQQQVLYNDYSAKYAQQNAAAIAAEKAQASASSDSKEVSSSIQEFEEAINRSQNNAGLVSGDSTLGNAIASKALTRKGYMYVWGGCHSMSAIRNPNQTEFDCSGLVAWAHYQAGVNIGVQYTGSLNGLGIQVNRNSMQAGDIILFSSNGKASGIHHVGIYIGGNSMVHAVRLADNRVSSLCGNKFKFLTSCTCFCLQGNGWIVLITSTSG